MDREGSFDADAERDLPDREGLLQPASLTADDDALEARDALATRLDDAHVHTHGVARPEGGDVRAQIGLVDEVGGFHGGKPMIAGDSALLRRPFDQVRAVATGFLERGVMPPSLDLTVI